jgi:hypothetical protein
MKMIKGREFRAHEASLLKLDKHCSNCGAGPPQSSLEEQEQNNNNNNNNNHNNNHNNAPAADRTDLHVHVAVGGLDRLKCINGHAICLDCGRKLAFLSDASPTKMKYDCPAPQCQTGCVLNVNSALMLIKGRSDWELPHGEGTRTDL